MGRVIRCFGTCRHDSRSVAGFGGLARLTKWGSMHIRSSVWIMLLLVPGVSGGSDVYVASSSCTTNSDCASGEFCKFTDYTCRGPGECTTPPEICTMDYSPVCGCDGKPYPNACGAYAQRMSVKSRGECTSVTREDVVEDLPAVDDDLTPATPLHSEDGTLCWQHLGYAGCQPDQFCLYGVGTCGVDGKPGVCVERPYICPRLWAPVCGCDGHDYSNECHASVRGVSIYKRSACGGGFAPSG